MSRLIAVLAVAVLMLGGITAPADAAVLKVGLDQPFKTVQDAVIAAGDFDTISIEPGVYFASHSIYVNGRQGLNIEGAPNGRVRLVVTDLYEAVIALNNCNNVRISNINAYHEPQGGTSVCSGAVIQLTRCNNITIIDNELNGCGIIGVSAFDSYNVNVIRNNLHHNSYAALNFYRSTGLVQENVIANNGQVIVGNTGGVTFKNNTVTMTNAVLNAGVPLSIEDFSLMTVRLGDPVAALLQKMGAKAVIKQLPEGVSYDYGTIEAIVSKQNAVVNLLTDNKTVGTRRGIHPGALLSEVVAAYGEGYNKTAYNELDLYEYTFISNGRYVLRFAVQRDSGKVAYIGCRAAGQIENSL